MKLADLEKVGKLKSERDYLLALRSCAGSGYATMTLKGLGRGHDMRPDLVEGIKPALIAVVEEAVAKVDRDLASLGVAIQDDD